MPYAAYMYSSNTNILKNLFYCVFKGHSIKDYVDTLAYILKTCLCSNAKLCDVQNPSIF